MDGARSRAILPLARARDGFESVPRGYVFSINAHRATYGASPSEKKKKKRRALDRLAFLPSAITDPAFSSVPVPGDVAEHAGQPAPGSPACLVTYT